jgi:aryl-alcohol dehydrogenase-like predicted oxidoreductase
LEDFAADDWRRRNPRFLEDAFAANMEIVDRVKAVADRHQVTVGQVALAWVLAQGDHVVAIPGTKRVHYLEENAEAGNIVLSIKDLEELNAIQPPVGERYESGSLQLTNL